MNTCLFIISLCIVSRTYSSHPFSLDSPFSSFEAGLDEFEPPCDIRVTMIEVYNITNFTLNQIFTILPNVSIWTNVSDDKVNDDDQFPEASSQTSSTTLPPIAIDSTTGVIISLVLGALNGEKDNLTQILTNFNLTHKIVDPDVCMQYNLPPTDYKNYDFDDKIDRDITSNKFQLPTHVTNQIYPSLFFSLHLYSEESPATMAHPNPDMAAFSLVVSTFSYYLKLDDDGLLKIQHGAPPQGDLSTRWAWIPSEDDDNCCAYYLVNGKWPTRKVVGTADGDLMVPLASSQESSEAPLNFVVVFNHTEKGTIFTRVNNDRFCLQPYFASTLRLQLTSNSEEGQAACAQFLMQVSRIDIKSGNHNITLSPLYKSESFEVVENNHRLMHGKARPDYTVMLYFTSDLSDLHNFLNGRSTLVSGAIRRSDEVQDLKYVADQIVGPGSFCADGFLKTAVVNVPMVSCSPDIQTWNPEITETWPVWNGKVHNPKKPLRWNVTQETEVKMFKLFHKFQFVGETRTNCTEKGGSNGTIPGNICAQRGNLSEEVVRLLLRQVDVAYGGEVVSDVDNAMFHAMEGVVTFMKKKVIPLYTW